MPARIIWPEQIDSARLRFRRPWPQPSAQDLEAVFAWSCDRQVARFCGFRAHTSLSQAADHWAQMAADWDSGAVRPYLVSLREDPGPLIGNFHIKPLGARLNLGFAYGRRVWRQGYGLEALRFWCDWGLAQPQIWRIEAFCDVENHASRALLERAGLEFEGCLRRFYRQPELGDAPRDVLMFAQVDPSERI